MATRKKTKPDEDELTEIVKADVSRVDAVSGPANGTPFLMMKSIPDEQARAGLTLGATPDPDDPDLAAVQVFEDGSAEVAELAADQQVMPGVDPMTKAESEECPTCQGSGKILKGNRKCPDCGASGKVAKADLSAAERNALPDSAFAHIEPGGEKKDGKSPAGKRHYPVHDKAHADNAASRAAAELDGDGRAAEIARAAMPKIKAAQKKFADKVEKAEGDGDGEEPGSASWEMQDAANLRAIAGQLADLRARIGAAAERERIEVPTPMGGGDLDDAWDLDDACSFLDNALGLVARLVFTEQQEAVSASMAKAGKRLSAKSKDALETTRQHLQTAHDHLTALLGPAEPKPESKEDSEGDDDMTKAEFVEAIGDALKPLAASFGELGTDVRKAMTFIEPPVPAGAKVDAIAEDGTQDAEVKRQADDDEPDAKMGGGTTIMDPPLAKPDHSYQQMAKAKGASAPPAAEDQAALIKGMLGSIVTEALKEGLSPLEKRLKVIEEQPAQAQPFRRGATGTGQYDPLLQSPGSSPGQIDPVQAALVKMRGIDPVAADILGRNAALAAHPFGGGAQGGPER